MPIRNKTNQNCNGGYVSAIVTEYMPIFSRIGPPMFSRCGSVVVSTSARQSSGLNTRTGQA